MLLQSIIRTLRAISFRVLIVIYTAEQEVQQSAVLIFQAITKYTGIKEINKTPPLTILAIMIIHNGDQLLRIIKLRLIGFTIRINC